MEIALIGNMRRKNYTSSHGSLLGITAVQQPADLKS
jgi:hypothetical protein